MRTLFQHVHTVYVETRRLMRSAARFFFADMHPHYASVPETWDRRCPGVMSQQSYRSDGSGVRARKRRYPAPEESLASRRQAYVARLWADDTKDFKVE